MGSFTDKDNNTDAAGDPLAATEQLRDPNRRRFSRNALVGSAVLMSLGNRSAWAGNPQFLGAMSVGTLNSFNPNTHAFISAPAQTTKPGHNRDLADTIHRIADPPTYLGTDGTYTSCKDPTSPETIKLYMGKKCPS